MFRLTIREVLWLTLAVGLGAGWFVEHQQQVALRMKQAAIQGELVRSHQAEALRARASEASSRFRASAETNP